jgi:hypothetical protein
MTNHSSLEVSTAFVAQKQLENSSCFRVDRSFERLEPIFWQDSVGPVLRPRCRRASGLTKMPEHWRLSVT